MTTYQKKRVRFSEKVLPAFYGFYNDVKKSKYLFYVHKGGRNSGKSFCVSMIGVILEMMKNPVNALAIRKVGESIQESVYEQLKEAIKYLEVEDKWEYTEKPLRLTYKGRGNRIIFRGAHTEKDIEKIKSIKTADFPIAILWVEEISEFKTEAELDVIENSVIRATLPGGLKYKIFYTYNPPRRKQSWVNKKYNSQFQPKNTKVYHTTYLNNPYVSMAFVEKGETLKERNIHKFKHIYMGEPIGGGIVPFDNLTFRTISDSEIACFDNIKQGLDWGYAVDPFACVRFHYDRTRRILYFIDEVYGVKLSNRKAAIKIKEKGMDDTEIIADSAEPKSIQEMIEYDLSVLPAKKGAGSVEYGEKELDDLAEIVIDYKRTPEAAIEWENIDYQIDRNGEIKGKLEDKNNHTIDCARYAMEDEFYISKQTEAVAEDAEETPELEGWMTLI